MSVVDLVFSLQGQVLPIDHGYALYGAISRVLGPDTHGFNGIGIHPIRGTRLDETSLQLGAESRLRVRSPIEHIPALLRLSGKALEVHGHRIRVGSPLTYALTPAAALVSRMVTIKGFEQPEPFVESARRKLTGTRTGAPYHEMAMSPQIEMAIPPRHGGPHMGEPTRRVLRIKDKTVVGFAVIVTGLTTDESLILQEKGLGGRRHMGCGIFVPLPHQGA